MVKDAVFTSPLKILTPDGVRLHVSGGGNDTTTAESAIVQHPPAPPKTAAAPPLPWNYGGVTLVLSSEFEEEDIDGGEIDFTPSNSEDRHRSPGQGFIMAGSDATVGSDDVAYQWMAEIDDCEQERHQVMAQHYGRDKVPEFPTSSEAHDADTESEAGPRQFRGAARVRRNYHRRRRKKS